MKRLSYKPFPKYAYIPLFIVIVFNSLTYFGTRLLVSEDRLCDLGIFVDRLLPFVPFFSLFYVLAYLQWGANYWLHAYTGREQYYHLAMSDLIAKLLCMICFLAIPATIQRPEITGDGFFAQLTALIYQIDPPLSLFPSIHCLESWIAYRAARTVKNAPRWYAPMQLTLSLLVCASTVLIKQHFFVDVLAGIAAVEIGWYLSRRFGLWRVFERLQPPAWRQATLSPEKETSNET